MTSLSLSIASTDALIQKEKDDGEFLTDSHAFLLAFAISFASALSEISLFYVSIHFSASLSSRDDVTCVGSS